MKGLKSLQVKTGIRRPLKLMKFSRKCLGGGKSSWLLQWIAFSCLILFWLNLWSVWSPIFSLSVFFFWSKFLRKKKLSTYSLTKNYFSPDTFKFFKRTNRLREDNNFQAFSPPSGYIFKLHQSSLSYFNQNYGSTSFSKSIRHCFSFL